MTHIYISKLNIIGSDNGLSPGWRQAIIFNNAGILLIQNAGTNFREILSKIHTFSLRENAFEKIVYEIAAILSRSPCVKDRGPDHTRLLLIHEENKQRVLMHGHQGWNVRHGLSHIYMRYVCIYKLFIAFVAFVVCSLLNLMVCVVYWVGKWQSRGSTAMFGNLMATNHIVLQFIQNHSRFVMLMIWK